MGNRANVIFRQANGYLGLYLHNAPSPAGIKELVGQALRAVYDAGRISDHSYGTRIAVSQIIGNDWNQGLSYGLQVGNTINQAISDNENDVVVIDWIERTVSFHDCDFDFDFGHSAGDTKETYSIGQYIGMNSK